MATSGSASTTFSSYYTLKISWTLNSQSTSNNTSNITFKAQLVSGSGNISSSASKDYTATINGTSYTGTNTVGISKNSTKTLFSKTLNISHGSDGSKSFTFKFKQEFAVTLSGSYVSSKTVSCTVTPTTIARASSISSASAVTLGNACSVKWTPASSSFAYKLKFTVGSNSHTTGYISPNKTSAYTYTGYTMSIADWAPYITTSTTATCTVVLYTYTSSSSSSSIGSSSKTFTVTVPSSVTPSVSINSVSESAGRPNYIQNLSKVAVQFTGTTAYSSPFASYTVVVGNSTSTGTSLTSGSAKTVTSGVITSYGTITITVTVKDSRGRSASATTTVSAQSYSAPNISLFDVYRSDSKGTMVTDSTRVAINYAYSCSSVNGTNSATYKIEWKDSNASEYEHTITTGSGLSGGDMIIPSDEFSTDAGFDFQISVTDQYSTSTRTVTVTTAQYPFSVYKSGRGVAFGKSATEEDLMDVQYPIKARNNIEVEKEISTARDWLIDLINDGDYGDTAVHMLSYLGYEIECGIGKGGANRGIYDYTGGRWLIYATSDNDTRLAYPSGTYKPYYSAGDTITTESILYTAGFVTQSSTEVRFTIPLTRPILGSPSISISGGLVVRQDKSYTHGSASGSPVTPSSWSVDSMYYGLRVNATMKSTTNAVNNAPCGIQATLTIKLS